MPVFHFPQKLKYSCPWAQKSTVTFIKYLQRNVVPQLHFVSIIISLRSLFLVRLKAAQPQHDLALRLSVIHNRKEITTVEAARGPKTLRNGNSPYR